MYFDFMVLPVPTANMAAYKKMLKASKAAWQRAGALAYVEAIAEDVKPGKTTSFPQSVKLKQGETVACAYLMFKNKAHRNKCWKAMMNDPFVKNFDSSKLPFDGKRMFFGGFKLLISF
ncbi:MAG: DUF1428 domain-containing protein [Alphaproteobacteria bacterium]|nr:DUF1428 domain-containing protein [Alphaproteobacteria bacterium]